MHFASERTAWASATHTVLLDHTINALTRYSATTPSPDRDLGAEAFARDELECPAQGKLFRVLGRSLSLNQNAPEFFSDHEMPNATMSFLANSLLDLLDESYHEVTLPEDAMTGLRPPS